MQVIKIKNGDAFILYEKGWGYEMSLLEKNDVKFFIDTILFL